MGNIVTTIFGIILGVGQIIGAFGGKEMKDLSTACNVAGAAGLGISAKDARNKKD